MESSSRTDALRLNKYVKAAAVGFIGCFIAVCFVELVWICMDALTGEEIDLIKMRFDIPVAFSLLASGLSVLIEWMVD